MRKRGCIFLLSSFLFLITIHVSGQKISLSYKNVPFETVLNSIKQQTGLSPVFSEQLVDLGRKVTVSVTSVNIKTALKQMLEGTNIDYEINNNNLYLVEKTQKVKSSKQSSSQKITGTIYDSKGETIVGATIVVVGTQNGTVSDVNGKFSLEVTPNAQIQISFVGYVSQIINVDGRKSYEITLDEDTKELDEVVVVGYGVQKKVTLTGSVASLNGSEMIQTKTANITNSLTGRVSGLVVNARGGNPGSEETNILIRGIGTTGDNSPLYVIDGVANRGGFERLTPEDIESISVLKDASASIYGAQAANGVILVTTKRGSQGKIKLTYGNSFSMTQPTRRPYLMNAVQYLTWKDEQNERNGRPTEFQDIINQYKNGTNDKEKWADTDWWAEVMDKWALEQQHVISLSGGSEKISYYLSGQYVNQDAVYKSDAYGYKQYNVRSNIDAQITKNLKVGVDLSYRIGNIMSPTLSTDGLIRQVFVSAPYDQPYFSNGLVAKTSTGNPVNLTNGESGEKNTQNKKADTKLSIRWDLPFITEGLYVAGWGAYDYYTSYRKDLSKPYDQYSYDAATGEYINQRDQTGTTSLFQQFSHDTNKTLNIMVGYDKKFNRHSVSSFVAYEQYQHYYEYFCASRKDLVTSQLPYLFAGADEGKDNGGQGFESARRNIFGRINYNFDEKYLAEFTLRYDASANFMEDKRWGLFPGLSLGWRISEESFFNKDLINNLKIRGSWGLLGNDRVPNFQYLQFYDLSTSYIFGETKSRTQGLTPGTTPNPDITWETSSKFNIGVDFGLKNALLTGTVEYFHEERSDILAPRNASIPVYTGMVLPDENIGIVKNQGFEIQLDHRYRIGQVNYNVGGQFSFAKSKIVFIDEAANIPDWQRRTGRPVDYLMLYEADGLYQDTDEISKSVHFADAKPGDVKFVNKNGDDKIDSNDQIILTESPTPKIVYGFTLGAEWKNISVNMLFQGQALAKTVYKPWDLNQQVEYFDGRWISKRETPNAVYPAAYDMSSSSIQNESTIWVKDNSFLRLKNIEISYTFSKQLVNKLGIDNLRISANANNLFFLYDKVKMLDPESRSSTGWYYPQQRLISIGLNLTF